MPLTFTTESDSVSFDDPVAGFTRILGKYWTRKGIGSRNYSIELGGAPGTDGYLVDRHGFRGMAMGPFLLWFIGSTPDGCIAAFEIVRDALENVQVSVEVPSCPSPFDNCNIDKFVPGEAKQSGPSLYRMPCEMTLTQHRL